MKKSLKKELKKGTEVELEEHRKVTKGKKRVARQIAKDHIIGEHIPDYYDRLATMEKVAKKAVKKSKRKRLKK